MSFLYGVKLTISRSILWPNIKKVFTKKTNDFKVKKLQNIYLWLLICSKIKYMYATKNICMQQKIYVCYKKIYMCKKNYIYATKKYICAREVIYMLQKNIYVQEKNIYICNKKIYMQEKLCSRIFGKLNLVCTFNPL